MDATIVTPETLEKIDRLNMIDTPEQIGDWKAFKQNWLTLQESADLISKSDRYVRNIIKEEKLESRTFVGGEFGKRPTRCVNKSQILAWYQANMDKKPEQVSVQANSPEFTQNQALATALSFRDNVQALATSNIQLKDTLKEVFEFSKEVAKMHYADREERREIERQQVELQKQQLKAQQDLLVKITTPAKGNTAFIIGASVVLVLVLGYFGFQYLTTQSKTFINQIEQKDTKLTETLSAFQKSLQDRDAEIGQLKVKVQELEAKR